MLSIDIDPSTTTIAHWWRCVGTERDVYRLRSVAEICVALDVGAMALSMLRTRAGTICAAGWLHDFSEIPQGTLGWLGFWIGPAWRGQITREAWALCRQGFESQGYRCFAGAAAVQNLPSTTFGRVIMGPKVGRVHGGGHYYGQRADLNVYVSDLSYADAAVAQLRAQMKEEA